ncbi:hypothetical protein Anapl_17557 [Anas platyrhynchos]|uniref:Uncharacterized protein n=1 Tax=Anas platyrhynchos TaxID=8839 RepID=R0J9W4_ANAPL|nr:hypothetical protein Anapl_17557 [Anas platyrhynchos]
MERSARRTLGRRTHPQKCQDGFPSEDGQSQPPARCTQPCHCSAQSSARASLAAVPKASELNSLSMHAGMYQSWCRGRRKGSGSEEWREEEKGEARGRGGSRASGGRLRDLLSEPHPALKRQCPASAVAVGRNSPLAQLSCRVQKGLQPQPVTQAVTQARRLAVSISPTGLLSLAAAKATYSNQMSTGHFVSNLRSSKRKVGVFVTPGCPPVRRSSCEVCQEGCAMLVLLLLLTAQFRERTEGSNLELLLRHQR